MENTSSNRGGAKHAIRFGFSWADEVEREEREQQEQEEEEQQQRRRWESEREQQQIKAADPFDAARPREVEQRRWETEKEREQMQTQTKADPFGAARPREVVLAEKGVDWRARDRELDLHHLRTAPRPRPRPRPRRAHNHAATTSKGTAAVVAAHGATPARGAPCGDRDAGRTPHPQGRRAAAAAASTPLLPPPPTTVSSSAWGGSKRKCAGEGTAGLSRRVRQVDDQRRKVFGELNVGEGCCASSIRASDNNKGCDSGGSQAQGIKSGMPAAVAEGENRCSREPATKVTATEVGDSAVAQKEAGESAVAQKTRGGKRRNGRRSKKTAKKIQEGCELANSGTLKLSKPR